MVQTRKQEIYYGSSFLSESGRFLNLDKNVESVEIKDVHGQYPQNEDSVKFYNNRINLYTSANPYNHIFRT